jgi:hypothetical protein
MQFFFLLTLLMVTTTIGRVDGKNGWMLRVRRFFRKLRAADLRALVHA